LIFPRVCQTANKLLCLLISSNLLYNNLFRSCPSFLVPVGYYFVIHFVPLGDQSVSILSTWQFNFAQYADILFGLQFTTDKLVQLHSLRFVSWRQQLYFWVGSGLFRYTQWWDKQGDIFDRNG
jgi:hypothetical protein